MRLIVSLQDANKMSVKCRDITRLSPRSHETPPCLVAHRGPDGVVYPVPEEEDVGEDCRPHPGPGARAVPAAAEDGLELPLAGLRQTHQGGPEVGVANPGVSVSLGAEAGGW